MRAQLSRKNLVVFTGAGISAESGLQTFRGDGGLWEGHRVEDVATPEAWAKDPALVLEFYNVRRRKVRAAQPNAAHRALVDLAPAKACPNWSRACWASEPKKFRSFPIRSMHDG